MLLISPPVTMLISEFVPDGWIRLTVLPASTPNRLKALMAFPFDTVDVVTDVVVASTAFNCVPVRPSSMICCELASNPPNAVSALVVRRTKYRLRSMAIQHLIRPVP